MEKNRLQELQNNRNLAQEKGRKLINVICLCLDGFNTRIQIDFDRVDKSNLSVHLVYKDSFHSSIPIEKFKLKYYFSDDFSIFYKMEVL